jgi:hypothetical protein
MQFVQTLQLVVHRHQLVADVAAVVDAGEGQEHRFDLRFAVD